MITVQRNATGPEARIKAADAWAEAFAEVHRNQPKTKAAAIRALLVILLTKATRDFLAVNDPMALSQAQKVVGKTCYIDFLEKL